MATLDIVYRDDRLIVINKPCGLLVHKSYIARDAKEFAIQMLRDQIGQRVYPVHRLDRKTSGLLMFCLDKRDVENYSRLFRDRKIGKVYHAIVRGHTDPEGCIDYPLMSDNGVERETVTRYHTRARYEASWPSAGFQTSRYSLVELNPETGRMHQLRRHMAHIFHPIIGDRPHGCNKQNRLWKERWCMTDMLLHAKELRFKGNDVIPAFSLHADYPENFSSALDLLENSRSDKEA